MAGAVMASSPDGEDRPADADGSGAAAMTGPGSGRPLVRVLMLAAAVVAADQATKFWAVSRLTNRAAIPLLGDFLRLRLVYNPGAALSIGSGSTWVFTLLAAAAIVVVLRFALRARTRGQAIALGLLLGGAATHLLDRLFRSPGFGVGRVVDFIDYNGWFVGNVADIALTVGCGILVVRGIRGFDP